MRRFLILLLSSQFLLITTLYVLGEPTAPSIVNGGYDGADTTWLTWNDVVKFYVALSAKLQPSKQDTPADILQPRECPDPGRWGRLGDTDGSWTGDQTCPVPFDSSNCLYEWVNTDDQTYFVKHDVYNTYCDGTTVKGDGLGFQAQNFYISYFMFVPTGGDNDGVGFVMRWISPTQYYLFEWWGPLGVLSQDPWGSYPVDSTWNLDGTGGRVAARLEVINGIDYDGPPGDPSTAADHKQFPCAGCPDSLLCVGSDSGPSIHGAWETCNFYKILSGTNVTWNYETWYRIDIRVTGQTITTTVYDVDQSTGNITDVKFVLYTNEATHFAKGSFGPWLQSQHDVYFYKITSTVYDIQAEDETLVDGPFTSTITYALSTILPTSVGPLLEDDLDNWISTKICTSNSACIDEVKGDITERLYHFYLSPTGISPYNCEASAYNVVFNPTNHFIGGTIAQDNATIQAQLISGQTEKYFKTYISGLIVGTTYSLEYTSIIPCALIPGGSMYYEVKSAYRNCSFESDLSSPYSVGSAREYYPIQATFTNLPQTNVDLCGTLSVTGSFVSDRCSYISNVSYSYFNASGVGTFTGSQAGTWQVNVSLDGVSPTTEYMLTVQLTGNPGHTATITSTFITRESIAPDIAYVYPAYDDIEYPSCLDLVVRGTYSKDSCSTVSMSGFLDSVTDLSFSVTTTDWYTTINTTGLSVGYHTIGVVLYDTFGKTASSTRRIAIREPSPPSIAITSPTNGQSLVNCDTYLFKGNFDVEVCKPAHTISVYIDGSLAGLADINDTNLTWQYLATEFSGAALGTHTIEVTILDAYSKSDSQSIQVNLTNQLPPEIYITSPINAGMYTLCTTIPLYGNYYSNCAPYSWISIKLDGTELSGDVNMTAENHTWIYSTSLLFDSVEDIGWHTIEIEMTTDYGYTTKTISFYTSLTHEAPQVVFIKPTNSEILGHYCEFKADLYGTFSADACPTTSVDIKYKLNNSPWMFVASIPAAPANGTFSIATLSSTFDYILPLTNTITVKIEDSFGSSSMDTKAFTLATTRSYISFPDDELLILPGAQLEVDLSNYISSPISPESLTKYILSSSGSLSATIGANRYLTLNILPTAEGTASVKVQISDCLAQTDTSELHLRVVEGVSATGNADAFLLSVSPLQPTSVVVDHQMSNVDVMVLKALNGLYPKSLRKLIVNFTSSSPFVSLDKLGPINLYVVEGTSKKLLASSDLSSTGSLILTIEGTGLMFNPIEGKTLYLTLPTVNPDELLMVNLQKSTVALLVLLIGGLGVFLYFFLRSKKLLLAVLMVVVGMGLSYCFGGKYLDKSIKMSEASLRFYIEPATAVLDYDETRYTVPPVPYTKLEGSLIKIFYRE